MPVHPGRHLHSSGLVHVPCIHPGSTWQSRQVGPAQPNRQRHSPGASQYPRDGWQSERQIATKRTQSNINLVQQFKLRSFTYAPSRRSHPSPCGRRTRTTPDSRRAGTRAAGCIGYSFPRKSQACSDTRQAVCSSPGADHNPSCRSAHRTGRPSSPANTLRPRCHRTRSGSTRSGALAARKPVVRKSGCGKW